MSNELSAELIAKAKWAADMMKADGVKPEQFTEELAMAYMAAIGRRIESIQNLYLTSPEAKAQMRKTIFAMCG